MLSPVLRCWDRMWPGWRRPPSSRSWHSHSIQLNQWGIWFPRKHIVSVRSLIENIDSLARLLRVWFTSIGLGPWDLMFDNLPRWYRYRWSREKLTKPCIYVCKNESLQYSVSHLIGAQDVGVKGTVPWLRDLYQADLQGLDFSDLKITNISFFLFPPPEKSWLFPKPVILCPSP